MQGKWSKVTSTWTSDHKGEAHRSCDCHLCHLANSTLERNIVSDNDVIDPIYSELEEWDVCSKYKEVCNPQCIDELLKPFYEANS